MGACLAVCHVVVAGQLPLPVHAAAADRLGESRLFFSAAQRRAIDGRPSAEPPPSDRRAGDGERENATAVTPQDAPGDSGAGAAAAKGAAPAGRQTSASSESPGPPPGVRIDYSGLLTSSQGHTFLINGVPWLPGAHGIRSISRDSVTGKIELQFDTGRPAVLSPGQSLERGARP